jgi:hypothetical protein
VGGITRKPSSARCWFSLAMLELEAGFGVELLLHEFTVSPTTNIAPIVTRSGVKP